MLAWKPTAVTASCAIGSLILRLLTVARDSGRGVDPEGVAKAPVVGVEAGCEPDEPNAVSTRVTTAKAPTTASTAIRRARC